MYNVPADVASRVEYVVGDVHAERIGWVAWESWYVTEAGREVTHHALFTSRTDALAFARRLAVDFGERSYGANARPLYILSKVAPK